jgi:hypothetical protein
MATYCIALQLAAQEKRRPQTRHPESSDPWGNYDSYRKRRAKISLFPMLRPPQFRLQVPSHTDHFDLPPMAEVKDMISGFIPLPSKDFDRAVTRTKDAAKAKINK